MAFDSRKLKRVLLMGIAGCVMLLAAWTISVALPGAMAERRLAAAVSKGDLSTVKTLLAQGTDPNALGMNPCLPDCSLTPGTAPVLVLAAANNDLDMAQCIVAAGAKVEARSRDGLTPLMWSHSGAMAQFLLERGANANTKGPGDWTALMYAAAAHDAEVVDVLVRHGAVVNTQNSEGETALFLASQGEPTPVLKILLNGGANPNVGNHHKLTPLAYVARSTHNPQVATLLLAYGANPNIRDDTGNTVLDYAARANEPGLAAIVTDAVRK